MDASSDLSLNLENRGWIKHAQYLWFGWEESGKKIERFLAMNWDYLSVQACRKKHYRRVYLKCPDCDQGVEGLMNAENLRSLKRFCLA